MSAKYNTGPRHLVHASVGCMYGRPSVMECDMHNGRPSVMRRELTQHHIMTGGWHVGAAELETIYH